MCLYVQPAVQDGGGMFRLRRWGGVGAGRHSILGRISGEVAQMQEIGKALAHVKLVI